MIKHFFFTRSNFPLLYRSLCETLVSAASEELSKVQDDHEECLKTWSQIIETMQLLVAIVKLQSSRINLCALLKVCPLILKKIYF